MSNEVIEVQEAPVQAYPNMPHAQNLPTDAINQGTVAVESQRAIAEAQGKLVIAKRFPRDEVEAYAKAVERIFKKPVKEKVLYFFSIDQAANL